MHRVALAAILILSPLAVAQAQSMPVAEFLATADGLRKKGPMALFSGDMGRLKAEVQNSGKALRAEQQAARRAGRTPATCIPDKAAVNSDELLAHFRAIPPAQRNVPVKAAFASLMSKKYPCPKA
jgi:hypothetical protein